jgi:micrococcal nuclease
MEKVRRNWIRLIGVLVLLSGLWGCVEEARQEERRPKPVGEEATVVRVVDGDTIRVNYQGQEQAVRLIGIDTPESRANKKAKKDAERSGEDVRAITALGKEAAKHTRSLVKKGDQVLLEFDVQKRDKYKRLLAYVWLSDGRMLNEQIVKDGYASVMTYPPNVKYQDRFVAAYREARESRRGLWW